MCSLCHIGFWFLVDCLRALQPARNDASVLRAVAKRLHIFPHERSHSGLKIARTPVRVAQVDGKHGCHRGVEMRVLNHPHHHLEQDHKRSVFVVLFLDVPTAILLAIFWNVTVSINGYVWHVPLIVLAFTCGVRSNFQNRFVVVLASGLILSHVSCTRRWALCPW